jgi:hypothetical protein
MSIPVEIADLVPATERYGWAYLLTVRDDQRPHIVAVDPVWSDELLEMTVGRGSAANASRRPQVSLCYPPTEPGGYSLIVDGTAHVAGGADVEGGLVRLAPSTAVLHRPAVPGFGGSPSGCESDCLPVDSLRAGGSG